MPNWTTNILEVTGDEKQLQKLVNKIYRRGEEGHIIDFNGTVPLPPELSDTVSGSENLKPEHQKERSKEYIERFGADNWYDWNRKNWGCKWNASDAGEPESKPGLFRVWFNTPWSPPGQWVAQTAIKFPKLNFVLYYQGEGAEYQGKLSLHTTDEGVDYDEEEWTPHEWGMEFDETYRDEYNFITHGDYQKVLEEYTQEDAELNYSSLAPFLLERIKKDDLPLFLNFEWYGAEDTFEKLLKGE